MEPQTERDTLIAAWRALAGETTIEGWRTIPVAIIGQCKVYAGRQFPGNEEALLVRFASAPVLPNDSLPQGRGFFVSRAKIPNEDEACEWITLCRRFAGSPDVFSTMAVDIISTLRQHKSTNDTGLINAFLSRILAWQEFMRRSEHGILTSNEEVGLHGELEILEQIIAAGVPLAFAVEAWHGPLGGLHDFRLGTGALEVKTTVAPSQRSITIASLEQLDDFVTTPLFLVNVGLRMHSSGKTIGDRVLAIRELLANTNSALMDFENRLLRAGYHNGAAAQYKRKFSCEKKAIYVVNEKFPRLVRGDVPLEIQNVEYVINLDLIRTDTIFLGNALKQLGAT